MVWKRKRLLKGLRRFIQGREYTRTMKTRLQNHHQQLILWHRYWIWGFCRFVRRFDSYIRAAYRKIIADRVFLISMLWRFGVILFLISLLVICLESQLIAKYRKMYKNISFKLPVSLLHSCMCNLHLCIRKVQWSVRPLRSLNVMLRYVTLKIDLHDEGKIVIMYSNRVWLHRIANFEKSAMTFRNSSCYNNYTTTTTTTTTATTSILLSTTTTNTTTTLIIIM